MRLPHGGMDRSHALCRADGSILTTELPLQHGRRAGHMNQECIYRLTDAEGEWRTAGASAIAVLAPRRTGASPPNENRRLHGQHACAQQRNCPPGLEARRLEGPARPRPIAPAAAARAPCSCCARILLPLRARGGPARHQALLCRNCTGPSTSPGSTGPGPGRSVGRNRIRPPRPARGGF